MKNKKKNLLLNEIDKKINNLEYRIAGALQRNKIQNITFDSNLENLISINELLIGIRSEMLLEIKEEKIVYDLGYLRKMFAKFHIFKNKMHNYDKIATVYKEQ